MGSVGVVTFDLWDCLFHDDSDEPKRAAAGLPPKPVARRALLHQALEREAPVDRATVDLAFDVADAAFRKVWHDQHVTWTVRERLEVLLAGLGRTLPEASLAEVVDALERMELEYRPEPAPHAVEALAALRGRYPLAIVSDAIFTPGRNLRILLRDAGMLEHFDYFVFSDEAGRSKPHRDVFDRVAAHFNVPVTSIVHVGDRPHNDLGGPHAVGARGVLLTVIKRRPLDGHAPDAVCEDYRDLPDIIDALDRQPWPAADA
ncbi:MAG TPA: HAD family hydrolase [Candidatus Hydrogenedentes bacterium]|nr:HAD family hydrolase [Candidatus Hydrogenedentota bacterium]